MYIYIFIYTYIYIFIYLYIYNVQYWFLDRKQKNVGKRNWTPTRRSGEVGGLIQTDCHSAYPFGFFPFGFIAELRSIKPLQGIFDIIPWLETS